VHYNAECVIAYFTFVDIYDIIVCVFSRPKLLRQVYSKLCGALTKPSVTVNHENVAKLSSGRAVNVAISVLIMVMSGSRDPSDEHILKFQESHTSRQSSGLHILLVLDSVLWCWFQVVK